MITENNKSWNGLALYEELCQEREAFKKMEAERRNKVQKVKVKPRFYFFSKIFSEIIQAKIITAPLIPVKVNFSLSKKYEARQQLK